MVFVALLMASCSGNPKKATVVPKAHNFYTQAKHNRVAAEWEPALGTMVVWPLSVPYKLVVELAKDGHLYTLVVDEAGERQATEWYKRWGMDIERVSFVHAPQGTDAWWVRDWGPSAVFTPDKQMKLGDGKYPYATPFTDRACNDSLRFLNLTPERKQRLKNGEKVLLTEIDDRATGPLGEQLGMEILELPFINTGGNVLSDGLGTAFSTCVITNENRYDGISEKRLRQLNKELLGITRYNIISNFEKYGIQHIDCFMKLLDEETLLVAEPPSDHELHDIYDNIVTDELSRLKSAYGRPYTILRIKTARYRGERLAAYTNSLIVNKTVYVPLFDIPQDTLALNRWSEVMPGYAVKGFKFALSEEPITTPEMKAHYRTYGWNQGDALHCRVRAIWDPEMLFVSVKKISAADARNGKRRVHATIMDYSQKGLDKGKAQLFWRSKDTKTWKTVPLEQIGDSDHFFADLPKVASADRIEYYISTVTKSGKTETRPKTAPLGTYSF